MNLRKWATIAAMFAVFLPCGCASDTAPTASLRRAAPAVSLPALDGQQISLANLKGKVVVLDFWATWCPPCQKSFPHLQKMASDPALAQRGLVVLAIDEEEKPTIIRAFLELNHYALTIARDTDSKAARAFGVTILPTTVIVGRDGTVQAKIDGWTDDSAGAIDLGVERVLTSPGQ